MKFAFEEFHLWYQFALSLMAAGKVSLPAACSPPRPRVTRLSRGELGPGTSAPVLWNSPVAVKKWMVTFNYSGATWRRR